jgi:hypothetical protein
MRAIGAQPLFEYAGRLGNETLIELFKLPERAEHNLLEHLEEEG